MDNFRIPNLREREHQIFDQYRRALAIKGRYKKTCSRCGCVDIPVDAFFPHKMTEQAPHCPHCNFLKEVHNYLQIVINLEKSQ